MKSGAMMLFVVVALGPLALMGALYVVALLLWLAGLPGLLAVLVERTRLGRLSRPPEEDD